MPVARLVCCFKATGCTPVVIQRSQIGDGEQGYIACDGSWSGLGFFKKIFSHPPFLLLPSFHTDSNENTNNDKNSITPISLSAITLLCPFPFLLKLYLTSSAVVCKQDYWYLSEMKVHFNAV